MERKKKSAIEIPDIRTKRRRALIGLTIALLLLASAVAVCLCTAYIIAMRAIKRVRTSGAGKQHGKGNHHLGKLFHTALLYLNLSL
jgi:hypothetical protein